MIITNEEKELLFEAHRLLQRLATLANDDVTYMYLADAAMVLVRTERVLTLGE